MTPKERDMKFPPRADFSKFPKPLEGEFIYTWSINYGEKFAYLSLEGNLVIVNNSEHLIKQIAIMPKHVEFSDDFFDGDLEFNPSGTKVLNTRTHKIWNFGGALEHLKAVGATFLRPE